MDGEQALPEEVWAQILQLLPDEDIKTMALVHRVFRPYASPIIWRRLTVCSILPNHIKKARAIRKNPHLARQVTSLHLHPANWVTADKVKPWTSLWIISTPTFWSALKHANWSHPILSWRYYRRSLASIKTSTTVVPLLTNIQEISVIPSSFHKTYGLPPLEPYCAIWAGLRTEHLQTLNLQFVTNDATQVFSRAMQSASPVVFESLQTLRLKIASGRGLYSGFKDDLQAILNCGRASLRSLKISFDPIQSDYRTEVFGALGVFPKLAQFYYESPSFSTPTHAQLLGPHLIPFLSKHRSTMKKLHLSAFIMCGSILHYLCGPHNDHDEALRLETFTFTYPLSLAGRDNRIPDFGRFRETLTCLMLFSKGWAGGFRYEQLVVLFSSLEHPTRGVLLTKLWIHVSALSPDMLDLMATSLVNLKCLEMCYGMLVGSRDQRTDNEGLFHQNMRGRAYPDWGLLTLDTKSWTGQDRIPTRDMKEFIPSLKEIGSIDWEDVKLVFTPWY
ncbi:hypothetical protein BDN72DRAFT_965159 [Pluteus cervinus]|uniref:Uncharacterized protein n=1 Tax=Pluteus cervinus TaxID=181527 RepID=A0ACD3A6H2_9AGAR|nr:hypothetical protein BDN72DRAFT_965159 [Pluteus cervinus]